MADSTKKTPTKYKFGQRELDLSEYLRHIGNNVQSYIDDRRKKKGWTDDLVKEFSDSYNRYMGAFRQQLDEGSSRFSTDDLGSIIDTKGEFSDIDNDGIDPVGSQYYYNDKGERITTDDYNALKDKKKKNYKTFAANREVARFFNIVGKGMADLKPKEKEKFDLNKHGFFSWWKNKYNPAGGAMNLKPFLDKDPVGADGKRAVTNRAKMAAGWLGEYLGWLKDKDFDYSGYEQFPSYEAYSKLGEDLKQKWSDNNWDADDLIAGQAFGIDNDWAKGFFTTEEDPNLTDAQREEAKQKAEEEAEKKKQEELKKSERDWIDQQYRIYEGSNPAYGVDNPFTRVNMNLSQWYDPNNNLLEENYLKAWDNVAPDQRQAYMDRFVQDPFNAMYSKDMSRNIVSLIQEGLAQQIGGEGDLAGKYYIPSKSDVNRRRALIYDPDDHSMYYTFIGDIPHVWDKLHRAQFKEKHGLIDKYDKYSKLENGGIISMQIGGDFGNKLQQRRDRYVADRAAERGVSVERYQNDTRHPNGEANLLNPNDGQWTAADKTHAASLVADLTAMGLGLTGFTPASAIAGATGTTGHLTADIMEDGLDWGDVGRAAVGYGLDALALIPGAGTFSQGAKVAKSIAKIAPRALAVLGTMGAVANIGPITTSFKKAMSSGPENKLTVDDYRNITQGLTLLMGGAGAAGRKFHQVRTQATKTRGPVAVQLRNKASGEVENKIFTGDQAKALSEAKDAKAMNDIIFKDHPELAGYELATRKTILPRLGKIRSDAGWFKEAGFRDVKPRVMRIRQDYKGNVYAENGPWEADIRLRDLTGRVKGERAYLDKLMADNTTVASQLAGARRASDYFKNRLPGVKTAAETNKTNAEAALNAERTAQSLAATESAKTIRDRQIAMERAIAGDGSVPEQGLIAARGELANLTNQTRNASANYRRLRGLTGAITNSSRNAKQAVKDLQRQVALKQHEVAIAPDATSKAALQKQLDDLKIDLKTAQNAYKTASSKVTKHAEKVKNAKNSRNSLKSSVQAKQKWLNENTTAKANDLKTRADKLEGLESAVNTATSRLDKLNQLIAGGHTAAYKKLEAEAAANNGKLKFKDSAGQEIVRDFKEIVNKYGLLKQGGKFANVRSFKPGGGLGQPIRNVQSKANWFEHMYSDDPMQKWLGDFNLENYKTFNSLQDSWINNKNETGYDPNNPDMAKGVGNGASENVRTRQMKWNETGTNATIGKLRSNGTIIGRGGTSDTEEGNYTDGYFGAQEFLRHGGTRDAWKGHEEDLKKLQGQFKERGLDYREDEDGMFRLYELDKPEEPAPDNSKKTTPVPEEQEKPQPKPLEQTNPINFQKSRNYLDPMSLMATLHANKVNDINTDRSIDAARKALDLKNPEQRVRYYQPNVRHLIEGQRQMGMMLHAASQPMTSDGALSSAIYQDAVTKALDRNQPFVEKYNTSAEGERDLQAETTNFNTHEEHIAEEANGAEMHDLTEYIASAENEHDKQQFLNWDALRKEVQFEKKTDENTRQAKIEQAQLDNLYSGVMNNPAAYGIQLTEKEQEMWNKRISGEITSTADVTDPEDLKALRSAVQKVNEGFYMAQQMLNGVPQDANFNNRFDKIRNLASNSNDNDDFKVDYKLNAKNGGILLKDGSKVDVAKIRARSKDADRLSKSISKSHDRALRDRERVDKTNRKRYKLKDYR